ncbi:septum formation initiator family protein [Helcobacillus massiliensis]|uniref:FtsB family cell division protein n=1 Tax=Helcobacillus massiliensis TaxID=521392 RepID=UPI0021A7B971|nr:septum formation initiator family protein [Helcobacillus massiliensis]MCT1558723.1 septum formation initiator family protein [Helcobacillus massiliensis]MCT2037442.1 septum formation initiator family protein [Helcobacillus massiliensis]MCT2332962.1 septum formation initiator family protein [Helcobacillus massiliensis]MDK7743111.1 septum formation initiator family protein [Helcobacillus massiliensis]WOO91954.1 septum formation initiator family protein [Helcobacillus massiliensis]
MPDRTPEGQGASPSARRPASSNPSSRPRAPRRPQSGDRREEQNQRATSVGPGAAPRHGAANSARVRSTSRPAASARSAPASGGTAVAARQRTGRASRTAGRVGEHALGITKRSLVLITVIVLALAALVPSVNHYVAQEQRLAQMQAQIRNRQQQLDDLEAQVARWDDPTFVAAQARERLLFVWPGETQYRLTDTSGEEIPMTTAERREQKAHETAWYGTLWDSMVGASQAAPPEKPSAVDDHPKKPAPAPASDSGGSNEPTSDSSDPKDTE